MAVSETRKKTRLYQVAKEFNISHDTLLEFLEKKGFGVKNHMSIVEDDMYEAVERQYRKDRVEAERHAIKRKEFDEQDRKRRGDDKKEPKKKTGGKEDGLEMELEFPLEQTMDTPAEAMQSVEPVETIHETEVVVIPVEEPAVIEAEEEPEIEAAEIQQVEITAEAPAIAEVHVEPPVEVLPEPEPPREEPVAAPPVTEVQAIEEPAAVEEIIEQTAEEVPEVEPAETVAETVAAEPEEIQSVTIESSMPKMGLTVKGKIELEPRKKRKDLKSKKPLVGDKPIQVKTGPDRPPAKTDTDAKTDTEAHKKKKKKRIVAVSPTVTTDKDAEALKKKKKKKTTRREVDAAEVNEAIRRTIASMGDFGGAGRSSYKKRKKARRQEEEQRQFEQMERQKTTLNVYEYATVSEIASLMNVDVSKIISSLIGLGVMASINQRLDRETIELVASEYGFDVSHDEEFVTEALDDYEDDEETLAPRPPIVTIMGHVDHGKTSLLDYIRNANVVAGESGGITQHIGAYTVSLDDGRKITFLDTPGHEAFTAMRARGAQLTDIVVLVVAADDSVMPQTVEAISHAQAAKVPIVIAINKIDKPEANPDRIKKQLAERNILVEEWGGKYGAVEISAKKGLHVEDLMERILLEADILDLRANPDRFARGVIVEARLDRGKGVVATVLVQKGTLRIGDPFVAGNEFGKVRAMLDERDNRVEIAPPSTPVQVLGFDGLPQAGDAFVSVESDREAREISSVRQQIKRESDFRSVRRMTLDDISEQIRLGGVQDLALIVKGDVDGSVEALSDSLMKLSNSEVRVDVIHRGVGAISESDVLLAAASHAIIIGFHVRPNLSARKLAETEEVDIRLYEIIYDAINDVKSALEGLLRPEVSEKITSTVLVREVFKISRVGTIAGCYVQDGKIHRNSKVRLVRDGIVAFTGSIESLKRFKDDVREVDQGFECGISLAGFNDIKTGDIIESYEIVETKRQLK